MACQLQLPATTASLNHNLSATLSYSLYMSHFGCCSSSLVCFTLNIPTKVIKSCHKSLVDNCIHRKQKISFSYFTQMAFLKWMWWYFNQMLISFSKKSIKFLFFLFVPHKVVQGIEVLHIYIYIYSNCSFTIALYLK